MPAKNSIRTPEEGTYSHIYNNGVEKRIIFEDRLDYETFLRYLKDYLEPIDPEGRKKVFTVNGRSYRGTPHQPKNYFGKVELLAYTLMPDHFHLILHQKSEGSIQRFLRSLSTRYSMYFNNKHNRSGALFQGPYKSAQVEGDLQLASLIHYLHKEHKESNWSSRLDYSGKRETPWVRQVEVGNDYNYKENTELLEGITLESQPEISVEERLPSKEEAPQVSQVSRVSQFRIPELAVLTSAFVVLVALGVRNINASSTSSNRVLGVQATPMTMPSPTPEPKKTVVVKITDGAEMVNIRQEPTTRSEKIGDARDGQVFEFVSMNSEWYEVKLENGTRGFISAKYINIE